ncbi:MAG TPA: MFS transporter [Burkholderiaceae bacterium]|nr:MFS transporter [Burkholderiaceae bacterium]
MPRSLTALVGAQVCLHACMTGTRMAAPLLALRLGYSTFAVGVLIALFALAPMLLALPAGRLADRAGYHRPVRIGVGMSLAGAGLATAWPHYVTLALAATLTGAGTSVAMVAMQRTAGRSARASTELKRVFSWLALAPAASNVIGPVVAGALIDTLGFRAAFAAMALLPLLALHWSRLVPPEAPRTNVATGSATQATLELLRRPALRRLLVVNGILSACWDVHTFTVPVLGHERGLSASAIGLVLGSFSAAATAVRLVIPALAERLREVQVLSGAMVATAVLFAIYPFTAAAWQMAACSALLGLALGSVQPMVMSTLHLITPPEHHGKAIALRMMTINFSSTTMPLLFGAAGAAFGAGPLFWGLGLVVLVGARTAHGLVDALSEPAKSDAPVG